MTTTELKLEALKLAYEVAFKIRHLASSEEYRSDFSKRDIVKDIGDIFKIADMNFEYLKGETQPCISEITEKRKGYFLPLKYEK